MELSENNFPSNINEPEKAVSKKELRQAMGYEERTFSKKLSSLETEIKELDKKYNKNSSLLNPRVARFIVDELGFDISIVRRTIKENQQRKTIY